MISGNNDSWINNVVNSAKKYGISNPEKKASASVDIFIFLLNDDGSNKTEMVNLFKKNKFLICELALASCFIGKKDDLKHCLSNNSYFDSMFRANFNDYIVSDLIINKSLISKMIIASDALSNMFMPKMEKIGRIAESLFGINHTIRDILATTNLVNNVKI